MKRFLILLLLFPGSATWSNPQVDIPYIDSGNPFHRLDLYLPSGDSPYPLIIWVHGGAWRAGSKDSVEIRELTGLGWAIASVDYRLSTEAPFPALVHDIKASIRFLRAKASDLRLDPNRFAIAGSSAGAHLAALVGLSAKDAYLEGMLGDYRDTASNVQAVVSFYGASNLSTILSQSTPHGIGVREPALELLFGSPASESEPIAVLASPIHYLNEQSCPTLLIHGDQDPQMPVNQTLELWGKCKELGVPTELEIVHGGGHGGDLFYDAERLRLVDAFLRRHL